MRIFVFLVLFVICCGSVAHADYVIPSYIDNSGLPFGMTGVTIPQSATDSQEPPLKSGTESYVSFFKPLSFLPIFRSIDVWLFNIGDASIQHICEEKGITKIHHVDERTGNFVFIWEWFQVKYVTVYGS